MAKNNVFKSFDDYAKKLDRVLSDGLVDSGEMILSDSKRLAPVDTGRMNRETEVAKVSDNRVEVRYNIDYSLYVHEDLSKRHDNGQAKFLQTATTKNAKAHYRKLANKIRKVK
jgi:hypothetical protein